MDLSVLGLKIESGQAVKAAKDLDGLSTSAVRAEDAVEDLGAASQASNAKIGATGGAAKTAVSGLSAMQARLDGLFGSFGSVTKSAEDSASAFVRAETEARETAAELDRLRMKFDPLYAASQKYSTELDDLSEAHRRGAISAQVYESQLEDLSQRYLLVGNRSETAATSMGRFSGAMRTVPIQLSQVAQQGAATGQWLQAFTIQAADIGLAFGAIGIAAGAAISVLGPMAGTLLNLGDEAKTSEDAMDEASGAMDAMREAADLAGMHIDDLTETYGRNAEAVRELYRELIILNQQSAINAVEDAMRAAGDEISDVETALRDFADARRELLQAQDISAGGIVGILPSEMAELEDAVAASQERLREEFGITSAQAYRISEALDEMRSASGPDEAAEAARRLTQAIASAVEEGAALDQTLVDVANSAAAAYRAFSEAVEVGNRVSETGMNFGQTLAPGMDGLLPPSKDKPSGRRSTRSSGVDRDATAAARIMDNARTAAEQYAVELAEINRLYAAGYLNVGEYRKALAALGEEYDETGDLARDVTGALQTGFVDVASEIGSATDALDNFAQSMARLLANKAFEAFIAPALDAGLSAILPGSPLDNVNSAVALAGARADGGPVVGGQTYLVGERGPELFRAATSGTIIPNHAMGGPVVNVTVHNEAGDNVGVDVQQGGDGIRIFIRDQMRGMIGSGEMDQPMSRYGLRPRARGR